MLARIKKFVQEARFTWLDFAIMLCIGFTLMAITHAFTKL